MKKIILVFLLFPNVISSAQTSIQFDYNDFEKQFLAYQPIQESTISQKDFDYASMIIAETKKAIGNDPKNFNLADYFNVLSAFITLKESEKHIELAFEKFKDAEGSCEYVLAFEESIEKNSKYDIIREKYQRALAKCKEKAPKEKTFDVEEYCKSNHLDRALIKKIIEIDRNDQKYRNKSSAENQNKQRPLDIQSQEMIDSLFKVHKTYIGKSLVGEKFKSVMWAVIQHSNLEMMERYLPIIQKAVAEQELGLAPLKMLIDRFYGLKYGYQVFGSQYGFGFELADEKKQAEIRAKYGIE